ncbi:MAG TPA: ATP-grasp domain-containing protein, partial [Vicinamibacterales bacterium]
MRVLVLSHTTGYQLRAFNDAAETLGVELVFATDRCHKLDDPWRDRAVPVRFHELSASLNAIVERHLQQRLDGVIAVGDRPVVLAARAADAIGLEWHPVSAALASSDKRRSRAALAAAGLPSPEFSVGQSAIDQRRSAVGFPCVLKPVGLSGSRGVIRVNDEREYAAALERIRALMARPEVRVARTGLEDIVLVERYVDGREFAVEGVLTRGALKVFAVFDKPD